MASSDSCRRLWQPVSGPKAHPRKRQREILRNERRLVRVLVVVLPPFKWGSWPVYQSGSWAVWAYWNWQWMRSSDRSTTVWTWQRLCLYISWKNFQADSSLHIILIWWRISDVFDTPLSMCTLFMSLASWTFDVMSGMRFSKHCGSISGISRIVTRNAPLGRRTWYRVAIVTLFLPLPPLESTNGISSVLPCVFLSDRASTSTKTQVGSLVLKVSWLIVGAPSPNAAKCDLMKLSL